MGPKDELHLVSVALPIPFPVSMWTFSLPAAVACPCKVCVTLLACSRSIHSLLLQPAAACPNPWPLQVSAVVDSHLPQPDVGAWRRRCREAERQAEAVTKRALRDVLAARVQASRAAGPARAAAAAATAAAAPAAAKQLAAAAHAPPQQVSPAAEGRAAGRQPPSSAAHPGLHALP